MVYILAHLFYSNTLAGVDQRQYLAGMACPGGLESELSGKVWTYAFFDSFISFLSSLPNLVNIWLGESKVFGDFRAARLPYPRIQYLAYLGMTDYL